MSIFSSGLESFSSGLSENPLFKPCDLPSIYYSSMYHTALGLLNIYKLIKKNVLKCYIYLIL